MVVLIAVAAVAGTRDRKKADFAMELGAFYCRPLQAPLIADIEREGVSYAPCTTCAAAPAAIPPRPESQ